MNYKVLYRKYRPINFDDVVGQPSTVSLLKDAIIGDKISHAYIFSGPRGTGKTSCAKILAKAINCLQNNNGNPCGNCVNCLNSSSSEDIYEIDAASNNGVDQIRELIDNIKLTPLNSRYKVYIIDEVHMLSQSAFNALLLTLEEPPSHVIFILATTNIEEVPITVLSRCQRLDFHKISTVDIENRLREISKIENIDISDDAIYEIAEYSDGGLRDALSLLDQVSKYDGKITQESILKSVGLISNKEVENLFESIEQSDIDGVINFVNKCQDIAADFKTTLKKIINVAKIKAINTKKLNNSKGLTYEDYKNLCFDISGCLIRGNSNINSYSLLELQLLNYIKSDNRNISREIFAEDKKTSKTWEIPVNKPKTENKDDFISKQIAVRINNCFVSATKKEKEDALNDWPSFLDKLSQKQLKGLLIDLNPVLASKDYIILEASLDTSADIVNDKLNELSTAYEEITKKQVKFAVISKKRWQEEMNKYKNNIKENIKYELMEEPVITIDEQDTVSDIFNNIEVV